jgi:hypothetical protein
VNNDFYAVAQKLHPDKNLVLEKTRKKLVEALKSVSTMFAGITAPENAGREIQQRLSNKVEVLNEKYPDIHWVKFCSVK